MASNPLLSTAKSSESSLNAALHPLVLLSISDYITRFTIRQLQKPLVGVLLGQQSGREVTIEHAYEVLLQCSEGDNTEWRIDDVFFKDRLQQYKDVYKEPPLELVGWWTISSANGPSREAMKVHEHIMENYNESALLLTFHPEAARQNVSTDSSAPGVKLPLAIYESVFESVKMEADDHAMQVDSEGHGRETLQLRLRPIPYEIATGEAEMISVDFVARGGGNATAVDDQFAAADAGREAKGKEKEPSLSRADDKQPTETTQSYLNAEEEELLAFLTTRANAIKMLQSRISLLQTRLAALPPSYLTSADQPVTAIADPAAPDAPPHQLLRAILALTAKLSLVAAHDPPRLAAEATATRADAALVDLLATLGTSAQQARELGSRFAVRDSGRRTGPGGGLGGGFGGVGSGGGGGPSGLERTTTPMDAQEILGWGSAGSLRMPPFGPDLDDVRMEL